MKKYPKERGAATLVVVMVMFLIVAMLAAYANRNLIFEQRVASNYVRSAVSHEAAEAGLEWTLAQLNGGKINDACEPVEKGTSSFRQRYLGIDSATGMLTSLAPFKNPPTIATCTRAAANGGWKCQCPEPSAVLSGSSVVAGNEAQPSFNIAIEPITRNGVLRILARGCNDAQIITCHSLYVKDVDAANAMLLSASFVRLEAAFLSALRVPPAAPLISKLSLSVGAQGVGLHNSDPRSAGVLFISGEAVPSSLSEDRLDSIPGTPGRRAMFQDQTLQDVPTDGAEGKTVRSLFGHYFGMPKEAYRLQPAMKRISCDGDCGQTLLDAYAAGARMLWVNGNLEISSEIELGTDAEPVVLVVAGPVVLSGGMRLHGVLYAGGDFGWRNDSGKPALLNGAAIVEGHVNISGAVDFWYLPSIMDRLNKDTGSFVRVSGSWSDMSR